LANSA